MKNSTINSIIRAFLFSICLLIAGTTFSYAEPYRVAILPFDVNAERDMTFLQEGIVDMLASRIAWKDKVEVINENKTKAALASVENADSETRALSVGEKLEADYVLFGSLTVFGDSVSIDAKMSDVSGLQSPLPFYAQTQGMSAVIPQINQFAANINETVFGRGNAKKSMAVATPPATAVAPAPQVQQTTPTHDPRMHPEKLLQSGNLAGTSRTAAAPPLQTPNPAFIQSAQAASAGNVPTFWKSRRFKNLITGLDIADVDNDGKKDLILATNDTLSIYRMEKGQLLKQIEAVKSGGDTFISVDAADINGNGTPEIYITSLGPKRTTVASFVIEHANGAYATLSGKSNWYYRVAKKIERGNVLLGQRQRQGVQSIFKEPIQELQWQGGQLVPGRQVLTGGKANARGVAYGDILHTGNSVLAAYTDQDKLRIYEGGNAIIWEDSEHSGGDMLSFNLPKQDPGQPNKQFFPLRIRTADINRDGQTEVLIARHSDLALNMVEGFRRLQKAKIELLFYNGLGLASQWTTQTLSGRVSDFCVGDIDNDGRDELVVGLISKEGSMVFSDAVSTVIAFELEGQ